MSSFGSSVGVKHVDTLPDLERFKSLGCSLWELHLGKIRWTKLTSALDGPDCGLLPDTYTNLVCIQGFPIGGAGRPEGMSQKLALIR
jgi:hypothetical protein